MRLSGPMRRILDDAILTVGVDFVLLFSFFLFFRLLAAHFDAELVGVYAFLRRVIGLILPIALLGMPDGFARYLAAANTPREMRRLLFGGFTGISLVGVAIGAPALGDSAATAALVFGDVRFAYLVGPSLLFTLGLVAHSFAYGALRGLLRIKLLNLLQFINLGCVPIVVIIATEAKGLSWVLGTIGTINGLLAALFLMIAWQATPNAAGVRAVHTLRQFYAYSVTRIPGMLVGAALASTVPIVAKSELSTMELGFLSIAITLLIGLAGLLSPLGAVLLPHLSATASREGTEAIGRKLHILIGGTLQLFAFITGQFLVFAGYLLAVWLGPAFEPAGPTLRAAALGLIGFGFYSATRSVLDAVSSAPINSINTTLTFIVLWLLSSWAPASSIGAEPVVYFACVYGVAGLMLGGLTYARLRTLFPSAIGEDLRHLSWGLVLSGLFAVLSRFGYEIATMHFAGWLCYETAIFLLYLCCLWALKFDWLRVLVRRVIPQPLDYGSH